jgi:DNA-binding NarL/FixJ family response regulator
MSTHNSTEWSAELSSADLAVLHLLADGHSKDEISSILNEARSEIEGRVTAILQVLSARNVDEAITRAVEQDLLGPAAPELRLPDLE